MSSGPDASTVMLRRCCLGTHAPAVSTDHFVVVHDAATKTHSELACNAEGLSRFTQSHLVPQANLNAKLVFLRGFPSLEWLLAVGAAYNVDPAVYRRHLRFRTLDDAEGGSYGSTLPSESTEVFQLNISTICSNEAPTQSTPAQLAASST